MRKQVNREKLCAGLLAFSASYAYFQVLTILFNVFISPVASLFPDNPVVVTAVVGYAIGHVLGTYVVAKFIYNFSLEELSGEK